MKEKLFKSPFIIVYTILICIIFYGWYSSHTKYKELERRQNTWGKLLLVLNQLDINYVDSIDIDAITERTIPYIMEELDPHSVYLPPQERKKADQSLATNFDGIGIKFNVPKDTAVIVNIISGGPSEKVGLLTGDKIIEIDSIKVAGVKINQDSLVSKMRGLSGTMVEIAVLRRGEKDLVRFDIKRGKIPMKSVDVAFMINDSTAYLKLSKFSRSTYKEFIESISNLLNEGMKELVLDLRDNTGGYLDQALLLANEFLEEDEMIVYMEGLHRSKQEFKADGKGLLKNIKLKVLINEGSASSSEIFAGAIQDNDRGLIYGRRSFGKGLVQEPINFTDKSGIRLTVARFYTPTGRSIQKPYSSDDKYGRDIWDRYNNGEMISADSIKINDSLKYYTPKGKIVYGGGGIIPDIFVPMDTIVGNELLSQLNGKSLVIKFSMEFADDKILELRDIKNLDKLNLLLDSYNLKNEFKKYLRKNGIKYRMKDWNRLEDIIGIQLRAMIARHSKLDDYAFYPIISQIDSVIQRAIN